MSSETDERYFKLKDDILKAVSEAIEAGYKRFICGMALGCDMMFAEAVLTLKEQYPDIILEAAVPCPGQSNSWNKKYRERYARLIEACDVVKIHSEEYTAGCMQKRNEYMVDNSSLLIAAFGGKKGGTFNTIRYASSMGLKVEIVEFES
ncbi:MAG: SLOG family protein [Oscillospiraceae bacterium]|nr:SLOG family protein [Oscillospiraceae bacterium]